MTGEIDLRGVAARLVRQSLEMGETEWFFDGLDRERAIALLRSAELRVDTGPGRAPESAGRPTDMAKPPPRAPSSEAGKRSADARSLTEMVRQELGRSDAPSRPPGAEGKGADAGSAEDGTSNPTPKADSKSKAPTLPVLPDDHDALRDIALGCTRCGLSESRNQVVFSDGAPDARLMVVGEAPGANEDETGIPFVGAAGKFLDLLLATVDLSREESVYICNVLKCRPPGNRNPEPREIETCSPYLLKQIEIVRPRAILAVGSFSAQLLTGREKTALGKLRGEVHSYQGVPLVVTYHPAALLRNGNWTRAFWDDLQLLRDVIDQAG